MFRRIPVPADGSRGALHAGVAIEPTPVYAPRAAGAIADLAESEHGNLVVMAPGGCANLPSIVSGIVNASVISGCDQPVLVVH